MAPVSETNPPVGKLIGIALCKSQAGLEIVTRASAAEAVERDFEFGSTGWRVTLPVGQQAAWSSALP